MKREVVLFSMLFVLVFVGCIKTPDAETKYREFSQAYDENKIVDNKLVAITDFNSTNYFIYRGRLMGYQYELLQEFADHVGKQLEVIVENDLENKFDKVFRGEVDLIASNLTINAERKKYLDFTIPHGQTRQVLIQQIPDELKGKSQQIMDDYLVRNQLDLAGKTIHVQKNSAYSHRLRNLAAEIGDSIRIVEVNKEPEELIAMVASGEIDYTVSDENIANINVAIHQNLDATVPVSFPQHVAWGVRKGNEELLEEINSWLSDFKQTHRYKLIYAKYFNNHNVLKYRQSDFFTNEGGQISVYDEDIKRYSKQINWDWRLVASMIYQESRFNPNVKSWAGAYGLMQLMPRTAERFGVDSTSSPAENIRAGVEFIHWLDRQFSKIIDDENEKIKFVLAAYNAGYGHIMDAMRLAEKNGKNPRIWDDNVDYYVLNKSNPRFYNDPIVVHGYMRGYEPYNYVNDIISRYEHYKNVLTLE
ncbi:MAG: transglycosylase SLT domain-containing protein [Bacteroidota bacterium]